MATIYTAGEVSNVAAKDASSVSQAGGSGDYMIHEYKDFIGSLGNCDLEWYGQSSLASTASTIYLQIYNINTLSWDLVNSDNSHGAGTDFSITGNVPSLTNYKDASNVITCRVYQRGT